MSRQHHCDHNCNGHNSLNSSDDLGILYSLYSKIDLSKVECLNETTEGSGKTVFKPWEDRLNIENVRILLVLNVCHIFFKKNIVFD